MSEKHLPFCYVAERDGCWVGVTAGDFDVERFYSDHAGDTIKPIATREEWSAYLEKTPGLHERLP